MTSFAATTAWLEGELFEATLIAAYGAASIGAGLVCWRLGATPAARALWLPLLLAGLVYAALGISMQVSNRQRRPVYEQQFRQDARQFWQAEKQRVEGFAPMYTTSKVVATVVFVLTLAALWFSPSTTLHGWALGLSLFATVGLAVDYFSQERASAYYAAIGAALQ